MRLKSLIVFISLTATLMAYGNSMKQSKNSQGMHNMDVRFLTFDLNGDGFLQRAEFYALRNKYPSKCAKKSDLAQESVLLFEEIDLNSDQKISNNELKIHRQNR